ncbi:hypothetical protein [Acinetobacter pittii]|uniref:hypothetical protein n=1 Tax=Acinetobacter pittii TaxID=48296 RepID=UPI0003792643|nr:hypothetical protein [Acinetobacter pittii]
MSSMLENFGAESSSAYKTAFALQKGFVLASALLNAKGAVMAAWNDPSNTTIWGKMAAAAAVVVQTNDLMSAIQGVALSGFSSGGYTGDMGRGDVAGVVHGQEYVLNAAATKRVGVDTLNAINSGQPMDNSQVNIQIINRVQGVELVESKGADGTVTIEVVRAEAQKAVRQGFANLSNANSFESKQVTRNTTARPSR